MASPQPATVVNSSHYIALPPKPTNHKSLISEEIHQRCRRILENTVKYLPVEGRYEAGVWVNDHPNLPDNRRGAADRLNRTLRRLQSNPEIAEIVPREMQQYFDSGFDAKLTATELCALPEGKTRYLPWHVVPHSHKKKKWRLVFDGASSFSGVSLNTQLLKSEVDLVNLICILIRFRECKVAVGGDISKMFHQVLVRPEDAYIYLFLWKQLE